MKKTTGKVVSLVLALALVVTSFSGTFAFAATSKTEYLPTTSATAVTKLVNGLSGTPSLTDVTATIPYAKTGLVTSDHLTVTTSLTATDAAYKSGSDLVTPVIDATGTKINLKLKNDSVVGKEILAVRYTGTSYRSTDPTQSITFSAEVDYTVQVVGNNSYIISSDDTDAVDLVGLDKNATATTVTGYVVKATRGTGSLAVFTAQPIATAVIATGANAGSADLTDTAAVAGAFFVRTANSNTVVMSTATNSFVATFTKPAAAEFLNVGTAVLYATPLKAATLPATGVILDTANTVSATAAVANTVSLTGAMSIKAWHGSTWALPVAEAATITETTTGVPLTGATSVTGPAVDAINVTGAAVELGGNTTMFSGSIGTVTASAASVFTLNSGYVAGIDDEVNVTLAMTNGVVGNITALAVSVTGGVTGTITAPTVSLNATDEKIPTVVGAITAKDVTIDSTSATVTTGAITEDGTLGDVTTGPSSSTGTIKLSGEKTTVPSINAAYYAPTIELKGFKGSIAAPTNAASSTILTSLDAIGTKTVATVTGAATVKAVNVADGTLTIATSLNVGTVTGVGTLVIPAGGLYVSETMNSVSLKLSNTTLTPGMTVFSAASYKLYSGMFKTVGFDIDYDAVSAVTTRTVDVFKIKAVNFAGIVIAPATGTSNKIVVGDKVTFNVTSYPFGTKLPDNTKIKFDFSGSSDNFTTETTASSITITAKKYDDLFASLNKATITATLVDSTTDTVLYTFDPATYDVVMIKTPEVTFKSDTNSALNVVSGKSYTFKITSLNGVAPVFTTGTSGVFTVAPAVNVAGSKDYLYTVTATGKVGSGTGIYVNGKLVLVATVKATDVKSDTTGNATVKGAYIFKLTTAVTPTSVTVGTPGVFKLSFVSKTGNNYFYKISSVGKVGAKAGIYVNGVLTFVGIVG